MGVLNKIKDMTPIKYCRFCLGVGKTCRCSNVPRQSPSSGATLWTPPMMSYPAMASSTETCRCSNVPRQSPSSGATLWTPPMMSYPAMASSTETTASSSVGGVPPQKHPPIGLSPADSAAMSYATMASTLRPQLDSRQAEYLHRGAHHPGCLHLNRSRWTHSLHCPQRTCWLLPVLVGENGPPPLGPGCQLLLALDRHRQHLPPYRCPPQEDRRRAQRPHTGNRCTRPNILPGYRQPPLRWAPPPAQARVKRSPPGERKVVEADPQLDGLRAPRETTGPPPEDL